MFGLCSLFFVAGALFVFRCLLIGVCCSLLSFVVVLYVVVFVVFYWGGGVVC